MMQLRGMPTVDLHPPGTFCWIDLATHDPAAARTFYTALFGWRAEDSPMPEGQGSYIVLFAADARVGAIYPMGAQMKSLGVPPHWKQYIAVEDVDAAAERVEALGGKIHAAPCDIPDVGRMAAVADREGATFNLFRSITWGLQRIDEPGAYCWSELYSKDPAQAIEFYGGLLGWNVKESPGVDANSYYEFGPVAGRHVAGMLKIQPEWGDVPPNWTLYFQVADLDASMAKVRSLGGQTPMPVIDIEKVGRCALVGDPTGAYFMIIQLAR
jgi:predicted enzyme related to lactoylglutathione lyase